MGTEQPAWERRCGMKYQSVTVVVLPTWAGTGLDLIGTGRWVARPLEKTL